MMFTLRCVVLSVLLFIVGCTPAPTQELLPTNVPTNTTSPSPTELTSETFTLSDAPFKGIVPTDWEEVVSGSYLDPSDNANTTYILHLGSTIVSLDDLLQPVLTAFAIESLPENSNPYETDQYRWLVYTFEFRPSEDSDPLIVDIATAEIDNQALAVILQTSADRRDDLYSNIFIPSVNNFRLASNNISRNFMPTTIPDYGISTIVPLDWQTVNAGSFSRGDLQQDPTTLLIQTSTDLNETEFRNLFEEQLGIATSQESTLYETDRMTWTIHNADVDADGILLTWQIATANDDRYTYLVVLFSFSDEADQLRDDVLFPVLLATQPST